MGNLFFRQEESGSPHIKNGVTIVRSQKGFRLSVDNKLDFRSDHMQSCADIVPNGSAELILKDS